MKGSAQEVVVIDQSVGHHMIVVVNRRAKYVSLSCIDCDYARRGPLSVEDEWLRKLDRNPRVQVVTRLEVRG